MTPCHDVQPQRLDARDMNAFVAVAVAVVILLVIGAPLAIGAGLVFGIMASTGLSLAQLLH